MLIRRKKKKVYNSESEISYWDRLFRKRILKWVEVIVLLPHIVLIMSRMLWYSLPSFSLLISNLQGFVSRFSEHASRSGHHLFLDNKSYVKWLSFIIILLETNFLYGIHPVSYYHTYSSVRCVYPIQLINMCLVINTEDYLLNSLPGIWTLCNISV